MDRTGARHRRQRQAGRLCRAGPAGRSAEGQALARRLLHDYAQPGRRFGVGTGGVFAGKGAVVRLDPGPNPPATALAEVYNVPPPGFAPRGADIDSKGVVWVSLGSGHLGSFDRRKCKGPLSAPKATAISTRRAGPSTSIPGRALPASATTAPRRAIALGSAHKTKEVSEFLDGHRNAHLHFTPTYASWLNQVELWFARIERDLIARGVFTAVPDLRRKLMRYIRQYNKAPKTITWRYRDPTRRITLDSVVTVH